MKVLGIIIGSAWNLKFDKHIAYLCAKAGRQLNVLQRLKGSPDYSSRLTIYKTFIMSNFNYCPIFWMFSSKRSFTAIENIQKRALRFVLNDYTSRFQELLNDSGMSGIRIMRLRLLAIEVYKCVKKFNPEYLKDIFILKESPYDVCDDSILVRPKVNTTNYGLKSFRNYGSKIWNILPPSFKKSLNIEDYKLVIHSWNGPECSCPVCDLFMK